MAKYTEDIFRQLFPEEESKRNVWLIARNFVLNVLPPMDGIGIEPDSSKFVHVVVDGTSDKMMAVVRQIALIAHYPNFDEEKGRNKTIITICTGPDNPEEAKREITEKGYLGNLLQYCRENSGLTLDLAFEFSADDLQSYREKCNTDENELLTFIRKEDIVDESYDKEIDVYKGMLVNMCYCIGTPIGNLPAFDNSNIELYTIALNLYKYQSKSTKLQEEWDGIARPDAKGKYREYDVKQKLSSLFCSDCFESRLRSVPNTEKKGIDKYDEKDFKKAQQAIKNTNVIDALVRSEHARWNVEKLILGYKPLDVEERYSLEILFGTEKIKYRKDLKKKYSHLDLCGYKELRRVNPQDLKYDYFLMLAIPTIMERWKEYKKWNS